MSHHIIITPRTRVLELIEEYPHLEEVLTGLVPAFKKLRNPVLRKTVARVATLQQAAAIANVSVEDLVNRLRREVGQEFITVQGESQYNTKKPDWFKDDLVTGHIDAAEMLAKGEHPVAQVISDLDAMKRGGIYKVTAPFLPAPMIDKAASLGMRHWVKREEGDRHIIYFFKE